MSEAIALRDIVSPWRDRLRNLEGVAAPVVVACSGGPDSLALLALAVAADLEPIAVHVDHGLRAGRDRESAVVACSGGSDSLALLALAVAADLEPIAVHVDHGLRAGSDRESALVASFATRLGARFQAERVMVEPGPNLEARARDARYEALERARVRVGATAVLVGHTADDQAETVLLNLLRGGALAGLGGMPPRRGHLVRPLLGLRRTDTVELCARLGLEPVDDPMNADPAFRRVWLRREVIPALERGAGRDLVPVLARQADVLRAESDFLDELARAAWPPAPDRADDASAPAAPLAAMPPVLARRAVRCWLGPPPPSFDEVERVLTVARGEARATEIAGGRRVRRSGGRLAVESSAPGR